MGAPTVLPVLTARRGEAAAAADISPVLYADREIILAAVKKDGFALRYASEEFHADAEIVFQAALSDWRALTHAAASLFADKDFVLKIVKLDARVLLKVPPEFLNDKLFMLECVKKNYQASAFASMELRKLIESFAKAENQLSKGDASRRAKTMPANMHRGRQ